MQIVRVATTATLLVLLGFFAPREARAGYELVPFGGITRIEEGDAGCRGESQGTATGLAIGASAITFSFGGRFTMLNSKGSCDTKLSALLLGIYVNAPLWKGDKDAIGVGGELIAGMSGRLVHPSLPNPDASGGFGFAGELVYQRALSQEGSVKRGKETFPQFVVLLQARAGYRIASFAVQDAAFNDVDYSLNGPYAVVGIQIYINPTQ